MPYVFFYCRQTKPARQPYPHASARYAHLRRCKYKNGAGMKDGGKYKDAFDQARVPFAERRAGKKLCLRIERGDVLIIDGVDLAFVTKKEMIRQLKSWHELGVVLHIHGLALHTDTAEGKAMLRGMIAAEEIKFKDTAPTPKFRFQPPIPFGWLDVEKTKPNLDERAFALKIHELKTGGMTLYSQAPLWQQMGFRQPRTGTEITVDYLDRTYKRLLALVADGHMQLPSPKGDS